MQFRIPTPLSLPSLSRTGHRVWVGVRRIDPKDKKVWLGVGGVVGAFSLVILTHTLLNPKIVVSPDIHPFASQKEYDEFVEKNPLLTADVPEGKAFIKSSRITDGKFAQYTIELSERPLKPTMDKAYVESYLSYLENSQNEAKEWIRSLGMNPDTMSIIWKPNPEDMRGKLLGESTKPIPQNTGPGQSSPPSTPLTTPSSTGTPVPTPQGRFPL